MATNEELKAISASAKKIRTEGMAASLEKIAENTSGQTEG